MSACMRLRQCGVGLAVLLACLGHALAFESPSVSVEGRSVLWTSGKRGCLIVLRNHNELVALARVQVTVFDAGDELFSVGPVDLAAGQTIVLRQPVALRTHCEDTHVFYHVTYERQGVHNETVLSGAGGSAAAPVSAIAAPAIGGLIALVAALTGVWLTHLLTAARERVKDRKEKFNHAEPLFNAFFVEWNRSPVPQDLQVRFDTLQRQILLDSEIVERYRQTYGILTDARVALDRKQEAAGQFEQHMRQYLMHLS